MTNDEIGERGRLARSFRRSRRKASEECRATRVTQRAVERAVPCTPWRRDERVGAHGVSRLPIPQNVLRRCFVIPSAFVIRTFVIFLARLLQPSSRSCGTTARQAT